MIICNLGVLMAERKLSIQNVADRTGLSRTTISALVNENGKGIQFDTLDSLCELLKVTPGELFSFFSVDVDFTAEKIDKVFIDEDFEYVGTAHEEEFTVPTYEIDCTLTIKCYIRIGTSVFSESITLEVKYETNAAAHITRLRYRPLRGSSFETFFSDAPYAVKGYIIDALEGCILETGLASFDEIVDIGSLSIDGAWK